MTRGTTVEQLVRYLTEGSGHAWAGGDRAAFRDWFSRLCLWPPNVFAVTATILHESGLYRVEPIPGQSQGARKDAANWIGALVGKTRIARGWWRPPSGAACCQTRRKVELPQAVVALGEKLWRAFPLAIEPDDGHADPELRAALLTLHYVADEACVGMGTPHAFRDWDLSAKRGPLASKLADAWASFDSVQLDASVDRLRRAGTLSCLEPIKIRILPKKHTPQVGVTLRSISLWVGAIHGEVVVNWYASAGKKTYRGDEGLRTNLLLVPWPFELTPAAFRPVSDRSYHQFDYVPPEFGSEGRGGPAKYITRLLAEAKRKGFEVDGVVFPEQALRSRAFASVVKAVAMVAPKAFVLAGVQAGSPKAPTNEAWLAVDGKELHQEKHHRWSLDASQIRQYHLGGVLFAEENRRYWERMKISPRSIAFAHVRPRLTLCHLICEDLARVEPVAEVVRAVGPNLVIALLLDGPQLEKRWPGRYASIFADDPGSSVLTLSALGMVRSSIPADGRVSTVVALWKDARTGTRELSMNPNAEALVLSLATNRAVERTFDGRSDEGNSGVLTFAGVNEIRLS